MDEVKCQRCDEKIKPLSLAKDWPSRLLGKVTLRVHRITWWSYYLADRLSSRARITETQLDLCDECWGSLLEWANRPNQERLKIAAENRRSQARLVQVAEERREREIARLMQEGTDG